MSSDLRPHIAIGHVSLRVGDVEAMTELFVTLGIRPIVTKDDFAVLELRGGTHLVLRPAEEAIEQGSSIPFDLIVDDVEASRARYQAAGLEVGAIREGRIHSSFDVTTPDGRRLEINSSHAGDRPV